MRSALGTATNQIINVEELGEISSEATVIDQSFFGEAIVDKFIGMQDLGTYDFKVGMNHSNTLHKAIRDDSRLGTVYTYVLHLTDGTNNLYVAFDGFISSTSIETSKDAVGMMAVSVVLKSEFKFVDDSA